MLQLASAHAQRAATLDPGSRRSRNASGERQAIVLSLQSGLSV
jgi:hypothetical protein